MKQIVKANFRIPTSLTFNGLSDTNITNDRVRITNHGLRVGQAVGFAVATGLPTGLAIDTAYYVIAPNAHQISFATSRANAFAGTVINLTAVGADATATLIPNSMGIVLLDAYVPVNAVITNAYYDVVTTFTSTDDSGTIALQAQSAGDLVVAIAISDGTNVWDAGVHGTLATAPNLGADAAHATALLHIALEAGKSIVITADSQVAAVVAVDALTAGELNLFIEYVSSVTSA